MKAKFLRTFSLNGTTYQKGAEAEFDEKTFKALLKRGVVEEAKPKQRTKK